MRATGSGPAYPAARAVSSTRSRRSGESWSGRLNALEMVVLETPRDSARSRSVRRRRPFGPWSMSHILTDPDPSCTMIPFLTDPEHIAHAIGRDRRHDGHVHPSDRRPPARADQARLEQLRVLQRMRHADGHRDARVAAVDRVQVAAIAARASALPLGMPPRSLRDRRLRRGRRPGSRLILLTPAPPWLAVPPRS